MRSISNDEGEVGIYYDRVGIQRNDIIILHFIIDLNI